jgi:hypothetical protein
VVVVVEVWMDAHHGYSSRSRTMVVVRNDWSREMPVHCSCDAPEAWGTGGDE